MGAISTRTSPFTIAASATQMDFFVGRLDEIAVYDVALTQDRITKHYNVGVGH
jgi:hypothetical protein